MLKQMLHPRKCLCGKRNTQKAPYFRNPLDLHFRSVGAISVAPRRFVRKALAIIMSTDIMFIGIITAWAIQAGLAAAIRRTDT